MAPRQQAPCPHSVAPVTKEERLLHLKAAWAQIENGTQQDTAARDQERALLLAHTLQEDMPAQKPFTEQEIAQALQVGQPYISRMLRYYRFAAFVHTGNMSMDIFTLSERRFRVYWQAIIDPHESRGKRTPAHRAKVEQQVFATIVRFLEEGKPPPTIWHTKPRPTVAQMFTKKQPLAALRKEMEALYTTELATIVAQGKQYLQRDRASYAPTFMADAFVALEKWHTRLIQLMQDFDTYVR